MMDANKTALRESLRARVAAAHRTALIIVMALGLSIIIYMVIGVMVAKVRDEHEAPAVGPMVFYVLAVFLAIGSLAYRRAQLRPIRLQTVAMARGAEGLIKHLVTTTIVSAALGEAIGIIGLLLVFIGGPVRDLVMCGLVGLLAVLSNYPPRNAWRDTVEYFGLNAPTVAGNL